ncbi:MAG: xylulose kinase [Coxiella sp. DG_40]|nr:MAG: xylulose kinase [Coxiella sp. DG_40]
MTYLGIDIGTSAVKTVLVNDEQKLISQSSVPLKISRSKKLWSEQNPEDWWLATCLAIENVKKNNKSALAALKAIGVTGQMHGAVCIDKNNKPLRPAILWNDGRSYQECDILNNHPADFKGINGNTVMPGFTAPKLLWIQQHEAKIFNKIYKVLLPKDYIRFKLSQDYATDLSDASGTSWLDVGNRCWSERLLAATKLTIEQMPKLFEGTEVTGELSSDLASQWGTSKNVKIIAGAGDNAAGAVSLGIIEPNRAMLSIGTSGVYFVPCMEFKPNPEKGFHTFCHCIPNKWHQMGVILSAASCFSWWLKITGEKTENRLITEVKRSGSLRNVPIFLPYLSGERTPHDNPFAQGVFFGITHDTNRLALTQAVLEGVAFAIADCQAVLKEAGTETTQVSVIGGGAKNKYWGTILANIINKTLLYHNESELGPAFGAARLAIIGDLNVPVDEIATFPKIGHTINPNQREHENYMVRFELYRKIYQQLRPSFC